MYNLGNGIQLSVDKLDSHSYSYTNITIIQAMEGLLPVLFLECAAANDTADDNEVHVKLKKGDDILIDCDGFIYERKLSATKSVLFSIYLVPKDFIYQQQSLSFKTLQEVIDALWVGGKKDIPAGDEMICNQMMEFNNKFLTKCLLCLKDGFNFTYEAGSEGNTLRGIDMNDMSVKVECKDLLNYSILDQDYEVKYNPLESITIESSEVTACGVINSNVTRFSEASAINYYYNYASNRSFRNRMNESVTVTYENYGAIKIGDIVELAVSPTLNKKYRAIYTQFDYHNHEILTKTKLVLQNE